MPDAPKENYRAAEAEEQRRQWWKTLREWAAIMISISAFCVSFGSCYGANRSADIAERNLQATHRAIVYLGEPDGYAAELVSKGRSWYVVLHFRNYGSSAAQFLQFEIRPVITAPGSHEEVFYPGVNIPSSFDMALGPSLVPGESMRTEKDISSTTKEELDAGNKSLKIVGRVVYYDSFQWRCESFQIYYSGSVGGGSFSRSYPGWERLCGKEPYTFPVGGGDVEKPKSKLSEFSRKTKSNMISRRWEGSKQK